MIQWWLAPLALTITAWLLLALTRSDANLPYSGFMTVAILIFVLPALAMIWLFCFLLSLAHP